MTYTLPKPAYRRLSDLQSGVDDWYSPDQMQVAYADGLKAKDKESLLNSQAREIGLLQQVAIDYQAELEAATEARDNAVQSAKYTADLCTQALADLKLMTAERDAYKLDAERWRFSIATGGNLCMNWVILYEDWDGDGNFVDVVDAAIAKEAK